MEERQKKNAKDGKEEPPRTLRKTGAYASI
jgi:hypothetical protein